MQSEERKAIDRRLARIEGQVRGIRRLVSEDAYCCEVIQQVSAVVSALQQVASKVASQHIRHCIIDSSDTEAHPHSKEMTKEELLDELDEVLARLIKA